MANCNICIFLPTISTNDIVIRCLGMENIITCISLSKRLYRRRSISFSELIWKPMHHCQGPFDRRVWGGEKRVHLLASFKRWRLRFTQARTEQSGYDSAITKTHSGRKEKKREREREKAGDGAVCASATSSAFYIKEIRGDEKSPSRVVYVDAPPARRRSCSGERTHRAGAPRLLVSSQRRRSLVLLKSSVAR